MTNIFLKASVAYIIDYAVSANLPSARVQNPVEPFLQEQLQALFVFWEPTTVGYLLLIYKSFLACKALQ